MKIISFINRAQGSCIARNYGVPACALLLLVAVSHASAQSSITFRTDGSVEVKNDLLLLQATALLNLDELYELRPDNETTGISMTIAQQLGPNARIEVRVFDYDDVSMKKGALIYAAIGTNTGWNEANWTELGSLFREKATISEKIDAQFRLTAIKTTDIKVLSQFEGLNTVCHAASPPAFDAKYIDVPMRNMSASIISFSSERPSIADRDDDDGVRKKCATFSSLNEAEKNLQQATKTFVDKMKTLLETKAEAVTARKKADHTAVVASKAKTSSDSARNAHSQKVDEFNARIEDLSQADKTVKDAENAWLLLTDARKKEEETTEYNRRRLAETHGQMLTASSALSIANALVGDAQTRFSNASQRLITAMRAYQEAARQYQQNPWPSEQEKFEHATKEYNDAETAYQQTKDQLANAQAAAAKAKADDATARLNYNSAQRKLKDSESRLKSLKQYETIAESTYLTSYNVYQNAKAVADQAEADADDARKNMNRLTTAYYTALEDADVAKIDADDLDEEVETAQQESNAAAEAVKQATIANSKASADVTAAFNAYDDDDDTAASLVAVTDYVVNPDLSPMSLIRSLAAFGSAYLFNDRQDDVLFHNNAINQGGLDVFNTAFRLCYTSGGEWCDEISPMPVVLIEVAIQNAELHAIKVPGLPALTADHLLPASKLYDNKENGRYVNLLQPGQYLTPGHNIVSADFANDVRPEGFSKYDYIKVPDFNTNTSHEFTMDNWGRLPLVGTAERLEGLRQELMAIAQDAVVPADEFFSLRHISHDFMKVENETDGGMQTYELWSLTINKEYDARFTTTVTIEGPFQPSNGKETDTQLQPPFHNHEIMSRMATPDSLNAEKAISETTELPLLIYPNPARDAFNIRFNTSQSSPVKLVVFNSLGVNLYEEETDLASGWHTTQVDFSKVAYTGVCFISVTTGQGTRIGKVLLE